MEHIDANNHQILHWDFATPQLAAELAVDLEGHLLHHGADLLLIADGLEVDHLAGHWLLHTAEFLNCGVSVVSWGWHHSANKLDRGVHRVSYHLHIGLCPVIGQFSHCRLRHLNPHLGSQLEHKADKVLDNLSIFSN